MPLLNSNPDTRQKRSALIFIVTMGIVSLFGDMTYEGARSIIGPYFALLGASALTVGFVSGLGEFIGYAFRLVSGYISDKTESYWAITIAGYTMILAIPVLAFAVNWQTAAVLVIVERLGKAVRSPARDTILSHATSQVGRGIGFGIHEFFDQLGAIIGPLTFSAVFLLKGSYRDGFMLMWIPALLTVATLVVARAKFPTPVKFEHVSDADRELKKRELSAIFWAYNVFIFLSVMGFASFALISYHFKTRSVVPEAQIPLLYAIAMGSDALTALAIGKMYDKIGMKTLLLVPTITILLPLVAFTKNYSIAFIAAFVWGIIMGMHETVMRAAIADLTHLSKRGIAYGIFNTAYGGAFLIGSTIMGLLYQTSIPLIIAFVITVEIAAFPAYYWVKRASAK